MRFLRKNWAMVCGQTEKPEMKETGIRTETHSSDIWQKKPGIPEKNCPVPSADAKKKENMGNYENNGREYSEKGKPAEADMHDSADKNPGKVSPYGVSDIGQNKGWVSVGISGDTAEFAVNTVGAWWSDMGQSEYQSAGEIFITADSGGSNGYRPRLWEKELRELADEIRKEIHVSHFPPGTSKWNKTEHKMSGHISRNWRGRPLISRETAVNPIGNTTTANGPKIMAMPDENIYQTGIKVSDEELAKVNLIREEFHGEWNYIISPNSKN